MGFRFRLGAPNQDTGGSGAGAAYVLYGPVTASYDLIYAVRMDGEKADDAAGTSLVGAGDVDGSGTVDLLVGVPGDDDEGGGSGSALLFRGHGM